jgi:hypothetical protein
MLLMKRKSYIYDQEQADRWRRDSRRRRRDSRRSVVPTMARRSEQQAWWVDWMDGWMDGWTDGRMEREMALAPTMVAKRVAETRMNMKTSPGHAHTARHLHVINGEDPMCRPCRDIHPP